ncbi:adenylate/guanylate cyclase domain-containing protein [Planctomycetota bacterium]
MAKLIIVQGDQHRLYETGDDKVITIGRAPDNVLCVDDPSLSRRHCELRVTSGAWWLHDKGSFNGTFLNDLTCDNHLMVPGDRIQLGTTVIYFVGGDEAPGAAIQAPPAAALDDKARAAEQAAREATSRKLRNFKALLDITKAVSSELQTQRLLTLIVDKAIELISAERGFAILRHDGKLVFEVARDAKGAPVENPENQISKSVINGVTESGEPVLTINAQQDLGGFMSIVALEVRSLLCVALRSKDKTLGALYVDSHIAEREFGEESLNLLQAFADQAAIALENASLYDAVVESREQEKRIRRIFQKYVPAEVVAKILNVSEGTRLSERLTATVLFSDIRSFTSISEGLQAEEVVMFLNDYLQRMVDCVFDEGGIVDKFVGDAVMAVWGAPFPKPDDPLRAVRAAIRMLDEVDSFNRDQRVKGGVEIRIGIGLHTGPLVSGNIGCDKKMEYTVIGDTVNVASRVEGLCKPLKTNLLITQQCRDAAFAAGGQFDLEAKPPVPVKGKSEKLQVYRVIRPNVPQSPDSTPFAGEETQPQLSPGLANPAAGGPAATTQPTPQVVGMPGARQSPATQLQRPAFQIPDEAGAAQAPPPASRFGDPTLRLGGGAGGQGYQQAQTPGIPGDPAQKKPGDVR